MTYTNPIYDMFERDRNAAYWKRVKEREEEGKGYKEMNDENWSPDEEPIII